MAKSLRSKWKRKMKQEKRIRYGKKELEMLKKVVEKAKENDAKIASETDVTMGNDELYTVVTRASRRRTRSGKDDSASQEDQGVEAMEPDQGKIKIIHSDTLQDSPNYSPNVQFPEWLGSHRRKKLKAIALKKKLLKKKEEKKKNKNNKNNNNKKKKKKNKIAG